MLKHQLDDEKRVRRLCPIFIMVWAYRAAFLSKSKKCCLISATAIVIVTTLFVLSALRPDTNHVPPSSSASLRVGSSNLSPPLPASEATKVAPTKGNEQKNESNLSHHLDIERPLRPNPAYVHDPIKFTVGIEDEIEVIFQVPSTTSGPSALLVLAHGCIHTADDFFPASPSCPTCRGMPIESRIARSALDRGFTVMAVTSQDRLTGRPQRANV